VHPDVDDRPWFVFRLSDIATAYVPADSEEQARANMRRNSYDVAPVDAWPLIGTRFCSRQALTASLLRKRA
jgi:hypothetical protein